MWGLTQKTQRGERDSRGFHNREYPAYVSLLSRERSPGKCNPMLTLPELFTAINTAGLRLAVTDGHLHLTGAEHIDADLMAALDHHREAFRPTPAPAVPEVSRCYCPADKWRDVGLDGRGWIRTTCSLCGAFKGWREPPEAKPKRRRTEAKPKTRQAVPQPMRGLFESDTAQSSALLAHEERCVKPPRDATASSPPPT